MKKRELFIKSVNAYVAQSESADVISEALAAVNPDNQIFGLVPEDFIMVWEQLMAKLYGKAAMETVYWWLYEAPKDAKYVDVTGGDGKTDRIWIHTVEDLYDHIADQKDL